MHSTLDGRYRLTRYLAPVDHNSPIMLDELVKWNDVELDDLQNDPGEMNNLATSTGSPYRWVSAS